MKDEMAQTLEKAGEDMRDLFWNGTGAAGRVLEAEDFPDMPGWAWMQFIYNDYDVAIRTLSDLPEGANWQVEVSCAYDKARRVEDGTPIYSL